MSKIKWQGDHPKRASHAFLIETEGGGVSLCGLEVLSGNGEVSDKPKRHACGSCQNKIEKLKT